MHISFEYREAQNLDESVRAAFVAAGYAPDAGRADRLKMIEDGLAQAEQSGDAESVALWNNILLAHNAAEPAIEKQIRQTGAAIGSLLNAAGLGWYDATFTVSATVGDNAATVSITRGPGERIGMSDASGTEVTSINPDAGASTATGLGGD